MVDLEEFLIPEQIKNAVDFVVLYAYDVEDWTPIKREIINQCPGHLRKYFSRRHEITKKHTTNEMEYAIVSYWRSRTGVSLNMPDTDYSVPRRAANGKISWDYLTKDRPNLLRLDDDGQ